MIGDGLRPWIETESPTFDAGSRETGMMDMVASHDLGGLGRAGERIPGRMGLWG